jgi:hypothetical protein
MLWNQKKKLISIATYQQYKLLRTKAWTYNWPEAYRAVGTYTFDLMNSCIQWIPPRDLPHSNDSWMVLLKCLWGCPSFHYWTLQNGSDLYSFLIKWIFICIVNKPLNYLLLMFFWVHWNILWNLMERSCKENYKNTN